MPGFGTDLAYVPGAVEQPQPKGRPGREFFNFETLYAECLARNADPHAVIAQVFTKEGIELVGLLPAARLAADIVLKAEGQTVNLNASVAPPTERHPVSAIEQWVAETVGVTINGDAKVVSED